MLFSRALCRYKEILFLSLITSLAFSLTGCHGNISPEVLRTCSRGVKTDGGCKNPDSCTSTDNCLPGFYCGAGVCKADIACSEAIANDPVLEEQTCGRGKCESVNGQWLCINPDTCTPNDPDHACIPTNYCTQNNQCARPANGECNSRCANHHGICTQNGCADVSPCNADWQCMEGKICNIQHQCVSDSDDACGTPPNPVRGECDRRLGKYVSKATCTQLSDCVEGEQCNKAGRCVKQACRDINDCKNNGGGACVEGECKNKDNCIGDEECLNGYSCVTRGSSNGSTNLCVFTKDACEEKCTGSMTCERQQGTLIYHCQSSAQCQTSDDCSVGSYCKTAGQACEPNPAPATCTQQGKELTYNDPVDGILCGNQSDTYDVVRKTSASVPLVRSVVTLTGTEIGKGPLSVEFLSEDGTRTLNKYVPDKIEQINGTWRIISFVELGGENKLKVKITSAADKIGDGIKYRFAVDEIERNELKSCDSAVIVAPGKDGVGEVDQDVKLYKLVVDKRGFYKISTSIIDFDATNSKPVTMGIYKDSCLEVDKQTSQLFEKRGAFAEDGVFFNGILEKGTYYIKLSAGATPSKYQLVVTSHAVECELSYHTCLSDQEQEYCTTEYQKESKSCECDIALGICKTDEGKGCYNAIEVNAQNIDQFKQKRYDLPNIGMDKWWPSINDGNTLCKQANDTQYVDLKDLTFRVTIPQGESFRGKIDSGYQELSAFILKDDNTCLSSLCESAFDNFASSSEPLYIHYENKEAKDIVVFFVLKVKPSFYGLVPIDLSFELGADTCKPNEYSCHLGRELWHCSPNGSGYIEEDKQECSPKSGCVDATASEPAHCELSPGDLCSNAIVLHNGDTLTGETFRYDKDDNTYATVISACQYKGLNENYPAITRDNVYKIDLKEGDTVKIDVTPKGDSFDPLIWVATDVCDYKPNTPIVSRVDDFCLKGVNEYAYGDLAKRSTETLEFTAPKDQEYYIFVANYKGDTNHKSDEASAYTISAKVRKKAATQDCDFHTKPVCDPSGTGKIKYCTNEGFYRETICQNGCQSGAEWCEPPQTEPYLLEGNRCEYPFIVDTKTHASGTIQGELLAYDYNADRSYQGRSISINKNKLYDYVGACYIPQDTDQRGAIRNVYAFALKAGDVLNINGLAKGANGYGYILENCYATNTCQSFQDRRMSQHYRYIAKENRTVYFVTAGNGLRGKYAFQWSIEPLNTPSSARVKDCYLNPTYCDSSQKNQVLLCQDGDWTTKRLDCPDINGNPVDCSHNLCDLGDIKDSDSSCANPIVLTKGSSFFYNPEHLVATSPLGDNIGCVQTDSLKKFKVKRTYYKLTGLNAGDYIRGRVREFLHIPGTKHHYGLYIANNDCTQCLDNSDPSCGSFDVDTDDFKVVLDYKVKTPGDYTVVLTSSYQALNQPAEVSLYVDDANSLCQEHEVKCDIGSYASSSHIRACIHGRWEYVQECVNGCDNNQCAGPKLDGNTPDTAIPLDITHNKGSVNVDFNGASDTSDQLAHSYNLYGGCLFNQLRSTISGPDRYYSIDLKEGDLLSMTLQSNSSGSLRLYLLDLDHRTCVTENPDFSSKTPFERTLYFKAAKAGRYLIVADSRGGSVDNLPKYDKKDITLSYVINPTDIPEDTLLRSCKDEHTLVTWSPQTTRADQSVDPSSWIKHEVTCPDTCAAGYCVAGKKSSLADAKTATAIKPPFAVSVDFNSKNLTSDANMTDSDCFFPDKPSSLETDIKDAFFKLQLEPYETLYVYMRSLDSYSRPFYYLFTDPDNVTKSCELAQYLSFSSFAPNPFTPFSAPGDSYKAGKTAETVYVGVDGVKAFKFPSSASGLFYFDIIKPDCIPGSYKQICSSTNHQISYCNSDAELKTFQCVDTTGANEDCLTSTNQCPHPSGKMCLDAIPVDMKTNSSQTFTSVLKGKGASMKLEAHNSATVGPDVIYQLSVASGSTITIQLESTELTKEDLSFYLLTSCDASSLITDKFAQTDSTTNNTLTYTASKDETIYLVVDSDWKGKGGFKLTIHK